MLVDVCDLCGEPRRAGGGPFEHGALSLCGRCVRLVGGDVSAPVPEEPGSLAAVSVAQNVEDAGDAPDASPSEGAIPLVTSKALGAGPTLRIPAALLDVLVRDLDGQWKRGKRKSAAPPAPSEPARLPTPPTPPVPEKRARPRGASVSFWSRGIMASAGVTLAVMLAFLSLRSPAPKAADIPSALAHEAPAAQPPSTAVTAIVSPSFTRPSSPLPDPLQNAQAPAPATRPATAPASAAHHTRGKSAPTAKPAAPESQAADRDDEPEARPRDTAGPVPEFGGRE